MQCSSTIRRFSGPLARCIVQWPIGGTFLVKLLNAKKGESVFLNQESAERLFEQNSVPVEGMPGRD